MPELGEKLVDPDGLLLAATSTMWSEVWISWSADDNLAAVLVLLIKVQTLLCKTACDGV